MDIQKLLSEMTLEEKCSLLSGADFWHTKAIKRLGIPAMMMSDGPHGLRKQDQTGDHLGINDSIKAVCFPTACATAASFDREAVRAIGREIGKACQHEDLGVILGPAVNIKRSPLCGRNFEYFSEDPYLAGEMAVSLIDGVQSQGVGTSIKHFAANSQEHRRMSSDSVVDERTLREIYFPAFEQAVKRARPWTVMCSYNKLNGTHASQNRELLNFPAVKGYYSSVPAGNVGDGLTMAAAVGGAVEVPDYTQVVYTSFTCGVGINEEAGLIVNDRGERFANEYSYQYHVGDQLAKTGSSCGYYIACPDDPNMLVLYGLSLDSTPKAESVEALAELIGVDPAVLSATVARYNELCGKGVDEDYGKPADKMLALNGPIYAAIKLSPAVTVTYGGIVTDEQARVLTADGSVVAGLYAAGETANVGLFGSEYPCCGMAIGSAVYFGRIAGGLAAAE